MARSRRLRALMAGDAVLLVVVAIFSCNFSINRYGVTNGFHPMVFVGLRYLLAGLFFTAVTLRRDGPLRVPRSDWKVLFGFCLLATLANQVSFFYGIHLASASTVALCFGAMPAFVGLLSIWQGLARPSARHWLATVVSFGGVALVAIGGSTDLSGDLGGLILAVTAVATFSLYTVSLSRLQSDYSPYRLSAITSLGISLPLLAIGSHGIATMDWGGIGWLAWGALAYTTVPGFILSNVLWIRALGTSGPNRASLYANLQVFGGAAVGVLLLGEDLSLVQVLGGAVIAVGIALSIRRLRLPRGAFTNT